MEGGGGGGGVCVLFNHGLGEPAPTPKSHNSTRVKKYLQVR